MRSEKSAGKGFELVREPLKVFEQGKGGHIYIFKTPLWLLSGQGCWKHLGS